MKDMSIKIARLAVLLGCCAVALAGCGKKSDQPSASKGQVVARVGEEVVTDSGSRERVSLGERPGRQAEGARVRQARSR